MGVNVVGYTQSQRIRGFGTCYSLSYDDMSPYHAADNGSCFGIFSTLLRNPPVTSSR